MRKETTYIFENAEELVFAIAEEYPYQDIIWPDNIVLKFTKDSAYFEGEGSQNFKIEDNVIVMPLEIVIALMAFHGLKFEWDKYYVNW